MKHSIRSFSVGLLTTGLILLAVYYFFDNETDSQASMETDEMISHIEQDGYRVLTEKEYIGYTVANANQEENDSDEQLLKEEAPGEETASAKEKEKEDKAEKQKKADVKDKEKEDKAEKQKKAEKKDKTKKEDNKQTKDKKDKKEKKKNSSSKTVTINISSGMASSEISALLQEKKVIDSAEDFSNFLEDNEYSERVQIGKHKVKKGMSFSDIAKVITK